MNNLRIEKRNNGVYLTCERGMVAQMLAGYSQTQEEDARILAAAPELLAALKEARDWNNADIRGLQEITPDLPMLKARRKALNKAIAKAEGN